MPVKNILVLVWTKKIARLEHRTLLISHPLSVLQTVLKVIKNIDAASVDVICRSIGKNEHRKDFAVQFKNSHLHDSTISIIGRKSNNGE